eukprot:gene4855-33271_t
MNLFFACLTLPAAVADDGYKFSGVRYKSFGLTAQTLSDEGWMTTYQRPYSHPTTSADLDRGCDAGDQVIVAAMDTSFNLVVAACGECSSVMMQTTDRMNEHKHNGVSWYRYGPEGSFGFHGSTEGDKDLSSADMSERRCESRLSWHVDQKVGGYRAGCSELLQSSAEYWKIILKLPPGGLAIDSAGGSAGADGLKAGIVGTACYGVEESTACGPRILVSDCLREDKLGVDARHICPAMCNSCISTTITSTTTTTTITDTATTATTTTTATAQNSLAIANNPDMAAWVLVGAFFLIASVMTILWKRATRATAKQKAQNALGHSFVNQQYDPANDMPASPYTGYIDQHPNTTPSPTSSGGLYRDVMPNDVMMAQDAGGGTVCQIELDQRYEPPVLLWTNQRSCAARTRCNCSRNNCLKILKRKNER